MLWTVTRAAATAAARPRARACGCSSQAHSRSGARAASSLWKEVSGHESDTRLAVAPCARRAAVVMGAARGAATDRNLSPDEAREVLRVRAYTLEQCADEIEMDRPDLARKWRVQALELRTVLDGENGQDIP